jgi:hypothetical protein
VVPAPAETTSPRRNWLGLAEEGPFWQGLNQATFFFQHPESQPVIERKSTRAIELAKAEAMACGARLLVVMLPSFDVVFPERARELSVHAAEVVDSGVAVRWHQGFAETLDRLEVEAIDLLPAFRRRPVGLRDRWSHLRARTSPARRPALRSALRGAAALKAASSCDASVRLFRSRKRSIAAGDPPSTSTFAGRSRRPPKAKLPSSAINR